MSEEQLEQAFLQFDKSKKGFLTLAEYKPYAEYIVTIFGLSEKVVSLLTHFVTLYEKVSITDIKRIIFHEPELAYMQKFFHPGARIIDLIKKLCDIPEIEPKMKEELCEYSKKILAGKIYESSEFNTEKEDKIMPWLDNFSSPRLKIETVEIYAKTRKINKPRKIANGRTRKRSYVKNLLEEVKLNSENADLIASIDTANFSIYKFADVLGREKAMHIIAYQVFRAHKAFDKIDEHGFNEFLVKIQKGYEDNEYHNDLHAADVLQMCHFMLLNGLQETAHLDSLDVNAFLVSAVIHDFMHPGVNNGFLQNSKGELALLYNDQSILENFHISQSYKLIWRDPACCIFKNLSKEESALIRKRIIACILHTDNARHFETLADMQSFISAYNIKAGQNAEKIINTESSLTEFESKQKILNICLHGADISNSARPFELAKIAAKNVMNEFFLQGDTEKSKGLPVSFLCDRKSVKLASSQIGFVGGIVKPYFEKLSEIFPGLSSLLLNVKIVEEEWRKLNEIKSLTT